MRRERVRQRLVAVIFALTLPVVASSEGVVIPPTGTSDEGLAKHVDFATEALTATAPLQARLLWPQPQTASDESTTRLIVETGIGGGVEVRVGDRVIPFSRIGKRVSDFARKTATYTFFGIALEPGPNQVTLTPLGAAGSRGESTTTLLYGPGPIIALRGELHDKLIADSRRSINLHIFGFDAWGHHAQTGSRITASVIQGDATLRGGIAATDTVGASIGGATASPPPSTSTTTVILGGGGETDLPIVAGAQPGPVRIQLTSENHVTTTVELVSTAHVRPPIVNGVVQGGLGSLPSRVDDTAGFGARRGRAAVFGSGAIDDRTNLTLAYDSAQPISANALNGEAAANPLDRPYATYGDASTSEESLPSQSRLAVRLDRGASSVGWGSFTATVGDESSAASYQKLLNGAHADLVDRSTHNRLSLFRAAESTAYARAVIPASGLATVAITLHPSIIADSDSIMVVTLDRHTGAVLSQVGLIRDVDYSLDDATGDLRFLNPPLPYDPAFNPNTLVVQYQYLVNGGHSATTGGKYTRRFGATNLELGYLNDVTGDLGMAFSSEELHGQGSDQHWSFAHAHAAGTLANPTATLGDPTLTDGFSSGDAYRGSYSRTWQRAQLHLNIDTDSADFSNPYGGLTTPGLLNLQGTYTVTSPNGRGDFGIDLSQEQNDTSSTHSGLTTLRAHLKRRLTSQLAATVGLNATSTFTGVTPSLTSTPTPDPNASPSAVLPTPVPGSGKALQGEITIEKHTVHGTSLTLRRLQNLVTSGIGVSEQPSETDAQVEIKTHHGGRAYLHELWTDSPTTSFAASTIALTGAASSTHSTALGFEEPLSAVTSITNEYGIDQTGSGSDLYSRFGVKTRYRLNPYLTGDLHLETLGASGASEGSAAVAGLTLAYKRTANAMTTLQIDGRSGSASGLTYTLGTSEHLFDDIAFVGTMTGSHTTGASSSNTLLGVTWRPDRPHAPALLAAYQHLGGVAGTTGSGETNTLSVDTVVPVRPRTEVASRLAYKLDGDGTYVAHTALVGLRLRQRLGQRYDIATETLLTEALGVAGSSSSGFAFETGYLPTENLRLAAGYSFSGMADPTLATTPTRRGWYVSAINLIDHLFGWGR